MSDLNSKSQARHRRPRGHGPDQGPATRAPRARPLATHPAHDPLVCGADHPGLGVRDGPRQRHRSAIGSRRRATLGADGAGRRAVHEGDDAAGAQLPGIRFQQHRHDRAGRSATPRRRRAPLLRQPDPPTPAGSQAHPAHPGLLGRPANGGRSTERRRQGRLRHVEPRRQPGHDAGERFRRSRPQGDRPEPATTRSEGLRHRSRGAQ